MSRVFVPVLAAGAIGNLPYYTSRVSLYATYLRQQGRLGELVGDREAAIAAYRRYVRLRARHEPVLDRDLATVRSELEKLERQSSGR